MRNLTYLLALVLTAGVMACATTDDAGLTDPKVYDMESPTVENFDRWDRNGDGRVEKAEFKEFFAQTGAFDRWDLDDDDHVTLEEFTRTAYQVCDTDATGSVSRQEWIARYHGWGEQTWDAWDRNRDGMLTEAEFVAGMEAQPEFEGWNAGGMAVDDVFVAWDADGDGVVSANEWTASCALWY